MIELIVASCVQYDTDPQHWYSVVGFEPAITAVVAETTGMRLVQQPWV